MLVAQSTLDEIDQAIEKGGILDPKSPDSAALFQLFIERHYSRINNSYMQNLDEKLEQIYQELQEHPALLDKSIFEDIWITRNDIVYQKSLKLNLEVINKIEDWYIQIFKVNPDLDIWKSIEESRLTWILEEALDNLSLESWEFLPEVEDMKNFFEKTMAKTEIDLLRRREWGEALVEAILKLENPSAEEKDLLMKLVYVKNFMGFDVQRAYGALDGLGQTQLLDEVIGARSREMFEEVYSIGKEKYLTPEFAALEKKWLQIIDQEREWIKKQSPEKTQKEKIYMRQLTVPESGLISGLGEHCSTDTADMLKMMEFAYQTYTFGKLKTKGDTRYNGQMTVLLGQAGNENVAVLEHIDQIGMEELPVYLEALRSVLARQNIKLNGKTYSNFQLAVFGDMYGNNSNALSNDYNVIKFLEKHEMHRRGRLVRGYFLPLIHEEQKSRDLEYSRIHDRAQVKILKPLDHINSREMMDVSFEYQKREPKLISASLKKIAAQLIRDLKEGNFKEKRNAYRALVKSHKNAAFKEVVQTALSLVIASLESRDQSLHIAVFDFLSEVKVARDKEQFIFVEDADKRALNGLQKWIQHMTKKSVDEWGQAKNRRVVISLIQYIRSLKKNSMVKMGRVVMYVFSSEFIARWYEMVKNLSSVPSSLDMEKFLKLFDRHRRGLFVSMYFSGKNTELMDYLIELSGIQRLLGKYEGIDDTIITRVLRSGRIELIEKLGLSEKNIQFRLATNMGRNLAFELTVFSIEGEKIPMLEYLLALGLDINQKTTISGYTPLHHAVEKNNLVLIEWMLLHGADESLRVESYNKKLPIDLSKSNEVRSFLQSWMNGKPIFLNGEVVKKSGWFPWFRKKMAEIGKRAKIYYESWTNNQNSRDNITFLTNLLIQLRQLDPQSPEYKKAIEAYQTQKTLLKNIVSLSGDKVRYQQILSELGKSFVHAPKEFKKFFLALSLSHLARVAKDEGMSVEVMVDLMKDLPKELLRFGTFSLGASAGSAVFNGAELLAYKITQQHQRMVNAQVTNAVNRANNLGIRNAFAREGSLRKYTQSQIGMFAGTLMNLILYNDQNLDTQEILAEALKTQVSFMIAGGIIRGVVVNGAIQVARAGKRMQVLRKIGQGVGTVVLGGTFADELVGVMVLAAELYLAQDIGMEMKKIGENSKLYGSTWDHLLRYEAMLKGEEIPELITKNACANAEDEALCLASAALTGLQSYLQLMVYWPVHVLGMKYGELEKKYMQEERMLFGQVHVPGGKPEFQEHVIPQRKSVERYAKKMDQAWSKYHEDAAQVSSEIQETLSPKYRSYGEEKQRIGETVTSLLNEEEVQVESLLSEMEADHELRKGLYQVESGEWIREWEKKREQRANNNKTIMVMESGLNWWLDLMVYASVRLSEIEVEDPWKQMLHAEFMKGVEHLIEEEITFRSNWARNAGQEIKGPGYHKYGYWPDVRGYGEYGQRYAEKSTREEVKRSTMVVVKPKLGEADHGTYLERFWLELGQYYHCVWDQNEGFVEGFYRDEKARNQTYTHEKQRTVWKQYQKDRSEQDLRLLTPEEEILKQRSSPLLGYLQVYERSEVASFQAYPLTQFVQVEEITPDRLHGMKKYFEDCEFQKKVIVSKPATEEKNRVLAKFYQSQAKQKKQQSPSSSGGYFSYVGQVNRSKDPIRVSPKQGSQSFTYVEQREVEGKLKYATYNHPNFDEGIPYFDFVAPMNRVNEDPFMRDQDKFSLELIIFEKGTREEVLKENMEDVKPGDPYFTGQVDLSDLDSGTYWYTVQRKRKGQKTSPIKSGSFIK